MGRKSNSSSLNVSNLDDEVNKTSFLAKGFNEKQIKKILCSRLSLEGIEIVFDLVDSLKASHHLTCEDITRIAARAGGDKSLQAVHTSFNKLIELGFNKKQIVKMVAKPGGSGNIAAVQKYYNDLTQLDFTQADIVSIVAHGGGSRNIEAVRKYYGDLTQLGFTKADIVKIVAHDGGSRNIEAVRKYYGDLTQLGFTKADIVNIVAHDGGLRNIAAVLEYYNALKAFNFTQADIVDIVAHGGGSRKIAAKLAYCKELEASALTAMENSDRLPLVNKKSNSIKKQSPQQPVGLKVATAHSLESSLGDPEAWLQGILRIPENEKTSARPIQSKPLRFSSPVNPRKRKDLSEQGVGSEEKRRKIEPLPLRAKL